MSPDNAVAYLKTGASLITNTYSPENCLRMAQAAKLAGGHVTFVGALSPANMTAIAKSAPGHVTFDIAHRTIKS